MSIILDMILLMIKNYTKCHTAYYFYFYFFEIETCYIEQLVSNVYPPASASLVLRLQVCTTIAWLFYFVFFEKLNKTESCNQRNLGKCFDSLFNFAMKIQKGQLDSDFVGLALDLRLSDCHSNVRATMGNLPQQISKI